MSEMDGTDKMQTPEQQNCLTDIVQTNKEILELLDQMEEKKTRQGGNKSRSESQKVHGKDLEESTNIGERKIDVQNDFGKGGKQSIIQKGESSCASEKHFDPKMSRTKTRKQHKTKTRQKPLVHAVGQSLGNLKVIQKEIIRIENERRITEDLVQTEKYQMYKHCLKARQTDLAYDDRIVEFRLPVADRSPVHELPDSHAKQVDPESNKAEKSQKEESVVKKTEIKSQTKYKNDRKELQRKEASEKVKQTQPIERPSVNPEDKRPLKSNLKKSREKGTPSAKTTQEIGTKQLDVRQTKQTITSIPAISADKSGGDADANVQYNISQMMQAFDLRTDLSEGLLKMQAQFMRTQMSTILPGNKEKFDAYAELIEQMSKASGSLKDDKFWSNLWRKVGEEKRETKLRFLQEMEGFFMNGINVDESWRILCLGSLSFVRAVLEGRFFEGFTAMDQYVKENPGEFSDPGTAPFSIMKLWVKIEKDRKNTGIKPIIVDRKEDSDITYINRDNDQNAGTSPRVERLEVEREESATLGESYWSAVANKEAKNGRKAKCIREKGMDTIFCLDVSSSMKGEPLLRAKSFIRGFIEGIQNAKHGDDIFEHVSLITFGRETKVQVHLTCDYYEVLRKLDQVEPGGPSPMFAGLILSWAAILGGGTIFVNNGYKLFPRIYIVSDGQITPSSIIAGPDSCMAEETKDEHGIVIKYSENLQKKHHLIIHTVPVGSFNMDLLKSISSRSGGKVISPTNWKAESRSFKNYMRACTTSQCPELQQLILDVLDPVDQEQIEEFLRTHERSDISITNCDSDFICSQNDGFYPLGSRVRRKDGFSSPLYGTVTKHFEDGFGVTWDHPDENDVLRVKVEDMDYVEQVDEPRVLKDELIEVGCRVKRGMDWRYGNQDGKPGNEGAVFEVQENGTVRVRWDHDGSIYTYNFGQGGRLDLEVIQPSVNAIREPVRIIESVQKKDITVTNGRNKNMKGPTVNKQWKWKGADGSWKAYPEHLDKSIEAHYNRNPCGSLLVTMEDTQYRIFFSTMEQMDINSEEKFPVSRL